VRISARSIRRWSGGTEDENPWFFTCLPVIHTLRLTAIVFFSVTIIVIVYFVWEKIL
jgi:hypothetical protein